MRTLIPAATATLIAFSGMAFAQSPGNVPPADAMPLPQLLQLVQDRENVGSFEEVSWDNDGYWEIELRRADGGKVEINVNPATGETLPRR